MCRRHPRKISTFEKLHDIWLQRWRQTPKYDRGDLDYSMKKLLIYYPKNVKLLKPLFACYSKSQRYLSNSDLCSKSRQYFSQIVLRYKGEFLKYQHVNLSVDRFPFWRTCRTANFLRLCQSKYSIDSQLRPSLRKILTTNKNLHTLEVGKSVKCLEKIMPCMKYMRDLKFLCLNSIPCLPLEVYRRVLLASSMALESVSLKGILVPEPIQWTNAEIAQFIKMITELPKLKRFNFDVEVSDNVDINQVPFGVNINQIPFSILKKREIAYNIRLVESQNQLSLSGATESGLESLEFLGINGTEYWHNPKPVWNVFQEDQLNAQEKAHRVLFVSIFKMTRTDISHLLSSCRNITTLDISLSIKSYIRGVTFSGLKHLNNLTTLFINIDNMLVFPDRDWPSSTPRCCSSDLFENLVFCAKTLKSLSIHLCGRTVHTTDTHILNFFKACSNTLNQFTLIHSYHNTTPVKRINVFYKGLACLKNLHSLNLLYEELDYSYATKTPAFEKIVLHETLRELYISTAMIQDVRVDLPTLPYLEKLGVEIFKPDAKGDIFHQLSNLVCLRDLEVKIKRIVEHDWYKLLGAVGKLKLLETMKLKCHLLSNNEREDRKTRLRSVLKDLDMVKKNHPRLRRLAYCDAEMFLDDTVWLFGKTSERWRSDVDSFVGKNEEGIPKTRLHKVYSI